MTRTYGPEPGTARQCERVNGISANRSSSQDARVVELCSPYATAIRIEAQSVVIGLCFLLVFKERGVSEQDSRGGETASTHHDASLIPIGRATICRNNIASLVRPRLRRATGNCMEGHPVCRGSVHTFYNVDFTIIWPVGAGGVDGWPHLVSIVMSDQCGWWFRKRSLSIPMGGDRCRKPTQWRSYRSRWSRCVSSIQPSERVDDDDSDAVRPTESLFCSNGYTGTFEVLSTLMNTCPVAESKPYRLLELPLALPM